MFTSQHIIAVSITTFLSVVSLHAKPVVLAEKILDLTNPKTHSQITTHDWTLGTTGARGWCQVSHGFGDGGTTLDSRQILITSVAEKSTASNKLKNGDVLLGINGKKFTEDARVTFAKALSKAEETGSLKLLMNRDGTEQEVTLTLTKLPPFSKTAPFDCPKSKLILTNGCKALAERGLARPYIDSHLNALALLATGDSSYSQIVRDHAQRTIKSPLKKNLPLGCWSFAFTNMFLCEYYLITRDAQVLPEIKRLTGLIANGQSDLGTWGHIFKNEATNNLNGYGAVNAVGIPCAISLVLARECGTDVPNLDRSIERSRRFLKSFQNLGAIPYGEHAPNISGSPDDNGKNSATAIFFSLLGDDEATSHYAQTSLATHGYARERGHAGNLTSILWSLPAISLLGGDATGAWMNEFGWYFDLARDEHYRFRFQGAPKEKPGAGYARFDAPGAYLLHYAIPLRKLRITGRKTNQLKPLGKDAITDTINYQNLDYKKLSDDRLITHIKSWSPSVRSKAIKEYKNRPALQLKTPVKLTSKNPFARIAAAKMSNDIEKLTTLLDDPQSHVRIEALRILTKKNKAKGFKIIMTKLSTDSPVDPLFMEVFSDSYLPISAQTKQVSNLVKSINDQQILIKATQKMLHHQVTRVAASGTAIIPHLKKTDQISLLPLVYEKAKLAPKGDVMFGNRVRTSCAQILATHQAQEGLETATALLIDESWGRNARLPKASQTLLKYKGHAKQSLPILEKNLKTYQAGTQWHTLIKETIAKIKNFPKASGKLKTISEL